MLVATVALECTVGEKAFNAASTRSFVQQSVNNWARAHHLDDTNTVPIPEKPAGMRRIVYLSNSHALTGGHVSKHLQNMLDVLAPGRYEILDMSDAGVFTPDMLQRAASALDYEIDALLLGVSYISFSDRMKLSMQSHSARLFFKKNIARRLKPGFWLRNYEIGLYLDRLFAHNLRLYRYRDEIRNWWEKPLAGWLRTHTEQRAIRSIELDAFRSWRFPDGYDRNLFQWRLYRAGRSNHIADLRDLLNVVQDHGIRVLASNLPVDWKKSVHSNNPADQRRYQREIAEVFSELDDYRDHENIFPKAFTTYDALHPTWHGARLHALDLVLRLRDAGLVSGSDDALWTAFTESDKQDYESLVEQGFRPLPVSELRRFRRFDISETDNAVTLLRRLVSYPVASEQNLRLLLSLAQRIEYWRRISDQLSHRLSHDEDIPGRKDLDIAKRRLWRSAVRLEVEKARRNTEVFARVLKSIQSPRASRLPVLNRDRAMPVGSRRLLVGDTLLSIHEYRFDNGTRLEVLENSEGRTIHIDTFPVTGPDYRRIDLLGDGSFIAVTEPTKSFTMPPWLWSDEALRRFGI